jgi:tape measure domain-containing protein
MAALGRSSADTDRALVQVRQGISKGKFELEDLKSIAEVIPGFFDQFAKSLGVTTEELFRLIGQGQIGTKEFLTFANTLNDSLGSGKFDGYQQNLNRLKNSITDAFVVIGDAGAWQVFNAAINTATVSITGAVGFVKLLGETLGNLAFTIANGDWTGFGDRFDESLQKVAPAMQRTTDALLGISDNAKTAGFNAAEAGKAIADGMQAAAFSAEDFLKKFDTALRSVTSSESLAQITTDLVIAFSKGDIAAGDFYTRLDDVQKKQLELDKAMGGATTALLEQETQFKKTTKQTEDAEKAANAYALKMAEIASNENIKLIQSKVSLDIAEVEANAKITVAAFESINTAIDSTGKTLTDMLGLLDSSQDWTTFNFLRGEIEKESKRRDDALKLQAEYIQAQIANLNAKTQAMQDGDALITIDGAGLQPHLEAFMWEILRTIQVRVNADGLEMLVGV